MLVLLISTDLFIGFYGHYMGATEGEFSVDGFINYISNPTMQSELLIVFIIAILVVAFMHYILKIR